jgi:hypothetical protein
MGRTRDTSKILTTVENIDVTEQLDERIFISSASPTTGNIDGRLWVDTSSASAPVLQVYGSNSFRNTKVSRIKALGGNVTISGIYTIHTFLGSGFFSTLEPLEVQCLVVGGGGGGTRGTGSGGSGAGGYLEGSMNLTSQTQYSVVVGAGGAAALVDNSIGSKGTDSIFNDAIALAGGVGSRNGEIGISGGSGGGAGGASANSSNRSNTSATQTNSGGLISYKNTGGNTTGTNWYIGSGGGGAGAVGENCPGSVDVRGGTGGIGKQWLDGNYYAGGGGGGSESSAAIAAAALGGGGASGRNGTPPTNGLQNTGGGAGGTGLANQTAAIGGSGIVIIRYLT